MYKIKNVMKKLGVSQSWIEKKIKEEKIKVIWLGNVRRITEEELERIKKEGVR